MIINKFIINCDYFYDDSYDAILTNELFELKLVLKKGYSSSDIQKCCIVFNSYKYSKEFLELIKEVRLTYIKYNKQYTDKMNVSSI